MNTEIITVTFSPCIDRYTEVPELFPDKKLKCTMPELQPGGGGINVARAIKKLEGEACAIYPIGGYTGQFLQQLMDKENISSLVVKTQRETRENFIIREQSSNRQYRFGMPGNFLTGDEWKRFLFTINCAGKANYLVVSGSLPSDFPGDIFVRLHNAASRKNARLIVDTSGPALTLALQAGVFMLKPNVSELATVSGGKLDNDKAIEEAARAIVLKYNCEIIVVSLGVRGALLVTREISQWFTAPIIKSVSSVGAGDSMVAGMVLALSRGYSLSDAIQKGIASGAAATLRPGTGLCDKTEVDRLYNMLNSDAMKAGRNHVIG